MEERGAEERCQDMTAFAQRQPSSRASRRVPARVGSVHRGAQPVDMLRRVDRRAHRSVEGGSELDASRAWASDEDVARACDALARVDGCCEHIHTGADGGWSPVQARAGLGWGHGTHTACRGENLVKDLAKLKVYM